MSKNRRKIHEELEVVQEGFANGVAPGFPLDQSQKDKMIDDAEIASVTVEIFFFFVLKSIFVAILSFYVVSTK